MAQSVERPALDFSSGDDLMVCGFELRVSLCADSMEPAWDSLSSSLSLSLSLSPSVPPRLVLSLFLKINKL